MLYYPHYAINFPLVISFDLDEDDTLANFEKRLVEMTPKGSDDGMKALATKLGEEIDGKVDDKTETRDFDQGELIPSGMEDLNPEERRSSMKALAAQLGAEIGAELGQKINARERGAEEDDEFPNHELNKRYSRRNRWLRRLIHRAVRKALFSLRRKCSKCKTCYKVLGYRG